MIKSFGSAPTRRFFERGKASAFRGLNIAVAAERLAVLDAATAIGDLSPLRSVRLHRLGGDRRGQWAMRVNGPWRICFRFERGDAYDVEIVDYHKG